MRELYNLIAYSTLGDHKVFSREELASISTEHALLGERGIVAVLIDERLASDGGAGHVSFVVGEFHSQEIGESKPNMMTVVFYGSGFAGGLRECRHTHWGEDGYVFYPSAKLIAFAFDFLGKWFDL